VGWLSEFAREGAAIALHYWPDESGANSVVQEVTREDRKARAFRADFRDVLVTNAGTTLKCPFESVTVEQFDTLYQVNVRAQFFLTQVVLPALAEPRPRYRNLYRLRS